MLVRYNFCCSLFLALSVSIVSSSTMMAQTSTLSSAAVATTGPRFEVSTVKRNPIGIDSSHSNFNNNLYTATNIQLKNLMQYSAYGIPQTRILGGPKWLDTERFDIEAKVDAATATHLKTLSRDQRSSAQRAMFQRLLADRFKLTAHWETRILPIYALVEAKGGPKLQLSSATSHGTHSEGSETGTVLTTQGTTLPELAETLTQSSSEELGRVVVDKTGLAGQYDITLKWTPAVRAESSDSIGPSLFTALQDQLGLRLEPAKGPVEVLVIDHIEMPTAN